MLNTTKSTIKRNAKKRVNDQVVSFDRRAYGRLLARELPGKITTIEEYDRALAAFRKLRAKGKAKTPEEARYQDLLGALLDAFDHEAREELATGVESTPVSRLKFLMEENGLKQTDLLFAFGAQSTVSNVLSGKRTISKLQAKRLAERFRVRADLFI